MTARYTDGFSLRREEIVGHPVSKVVGEASFEILHHLLERAMAGESLSFEHTIFYPRSGKRHVRAAYMPQRSARGEVEGVVALVADVSSEHRARQQAERLQAVTSALSQALRYGRWRAGERERLLGHPSAAGELRASRRTGAWLQARAFPG